MQVTALEAYDVYLMVNKDTGTLFPFSGHGLEFAQGSVASILHRCAGEWLLDSAGGIQEITGLKAVETGILAKLQRSLGRPYAVTVKMTPRSVDLSEFKTLVLKGLAAYQETRDDSDGWEFASKPYSEIAASVSEANDTRRLYEVLALPRAIDCLDLL